MSMRIALNGIQSLYYSPRYTEYLLQGSEALNFVKKEKSTIFATVSFCFIFNSTGINKVYNKKTLQYRIFKFLNFLFFISGEI